MRSFFTRSAPWIRKSGFVIAVLGLLQIFGAQRASADTLTTFTVGTSGWVQFGMCSPCPANPFPIDATSTITIDTSTGKLVASHITASGTSFGSTGPFSFQSQQSGSGYTLLTFSGSAVYSIQGNGNFTIQLNIYVPLASLVGYSGGALCSITNSCTAGPTVEVIQCVGSNCTGSGAYTGTYTANAGQLTATTVTNLPNAVPLIYPLVPSAAVPGGPAFTLTVNGTGFVSGAVVNWNRSARTTTFVSGSQVTAAITAADIASAGTATITVTNPTPGGTSNTEYFQITNALTATNYTVFYNQELLEPNVPGRSNFLAADFNGDGKLDLVGYVDGCCPAPNGASGVIYTILGNGNGTFASGPLRSNGPPPSNTGNTAGTSIAAADLNGDGILDLVLMSTKDTFIALGNGDGTFRLLSTTLGTVISSQTVTIADFNGDGILDLAYTTTPYTASPTAIQVELGNGDGTFRMGPTTTFPRTTPTTPAQFLLRTLATGDFNGDGKLDLLVEAVNPSGCIAGTYWALEYPGNGDGSFGTPSLVPGAVPGSTVCGAKGAGSVVVGDFNGDGKLDLAYFIASGTGLGASGSLVVDLGKGDGTFQVPYQALPVPPVNNIMGPLLAGDFNGDGKLDLVAGNQLFYGNGDGTLTPMAPSSNTVQVVQVGDFDGDGTVDLLALVWPGGFSGSLPYVHLFTQIPGPPDFSGGVTPQTQTAVPGGSAAYTISHVAVNGFNGVVASAASNLPPGVTATFNPPTVTGSGSTTLTLSVANTVPSGNYTITLTGTSGSISHSTFVQLVVNSLGDFSGSMAAGSDSIANIAAGQTATYTFQVNSIGGYTGNVAMSVSGLPPGATGTFSPSTVTGASGTSTLTVVTASSTPVNVYTLTITGTSGPLAHSGTVFLGVAAPGAGDFSGSIIPSSLTVPVGGSGSYAIMVSGIYGFTSNINLSVSGLPPGAQASYSSSTILGGTGSSSLTISAPPGTPKGTYTLTSIGSGGGRIREGVVTLIIQ